jgi:hypothetical protein
LKNSGGRSATCCCTPSLLLLDPGKWEEVELRRPQETGGASE